MKSTQFKRSQTHRDIQYEKLVKTVALIHLEPLESFINMNQAMRFRCTKTKKSFTIKVHYALSGRARCKICFPTKWTEDMKQKAAERRGYEYRGSHKNRNLIHLKLYCPKCPYEFSKSLGKFNKGEGCPRCTGKARWTIPEIEAIIDGEKKHRFLPSPEYKNKFSSINVQCLTCDYIWSPQWGNYISPHGSNSESKTADCPLCLGTAPLTEEKVREGFASRGWKLVGKLPNKKASSTPLEVICNMGHPTTCTWSNFIAGTGCMQCHGSYGETKCREIFEEIFGVQFKKAYPLWMKDAKKIGGVRKSKGLELDGYCERLQIAFEHQGEQHVVWVKGWMTHEQFIRQQERDKIKAELCKENGVKLVIIPQITTTLPDAKARKIIIDAIKVAGIQIP